MKGKEAEVVAAAEAAIAAAETRVAPLRDPRCASLTAWTLLIKSVNLRKGRGDWLARRLKKSGGAAS